MLIVGHKRTAYGPGFYVNEIGPRNGKRALSPADARFGYALGHKPPNYPVPATMDVALLSVIHDHKATVAWAIPWFKRELRR